MGYFAGGRERLKKKQPISAERPYLFKNTDIIVEVQKNSRINTII